ITDATVSSSSKNIDSSKNEKTDSKKLGLEETKKTNKVSKKTVNNSDKKVKTTKEPAIKKSELNINNLSKEEKNKFLILALQEYSELLLEQERTAKEIEEKNKKTKEKEYKKEIAEKAKQEKIILAAEKEEKISKKCPRDNYGQNKRETIVFNEFAWMGDKNDSSNEWIELKNIGSKSINMEGWKIYSKNDKKDIVFKEPYFIDPGGFVLLERSEKSVPNIKADLIFSDSLNNSNEKFLLYDSDCALHDTVIADPAWPAGNNSEKRTMEMAGDYTWHTYSGYGNNGIFGTPKEENSKYDYYIEEIVQKSKTSIGSSSGLIPSTGSSSKTNEVVSYCNQEGLGNAAVSPIIINEVSWMGTSNSSSDEWIELKNITNEEVSLNKWQLLDKNNDIKISFGADEKIEANGFYLLERTDDNSVLNISAYKIYSGSLSDKNESLRLFDNNCSLIDEVIADSDWPAGNGKDKKTMERGTDLKSWQTYSDNNSDNISGLFGTPNRQNSIIDNNGEENGGEENENNEDNENDEEGEDIPEESLKEEIISNFSIVSGSLKNQVILEWDKMTNASSYEIFYSLEDNIDENNLIKIDEYVMPETVENDNKIKATISDLYFGKKYYFAVRAKNSEEDFSLLSEKIEKTIEESFPILASKYGNYNNGHKYDFSGPASFSNAEQINKIMELPMGYSGHIVIDANSNIYLFAEIGDETGIYSFDSAGQLRWVFPAQGGDPFIGQDGTVYFNNSAYLFALSPSGKLKWKELFPMILSKDPVLDKEGNIFMMVIDSDDSRPDLFMVRDLGYGISREAVVLSSQLFGEDSLSSYSELAMSDEGEIYLGFSNKLIKYKYGQGIIDSKAFVAMCSHSYADSCDSYLPSIMTISIAQNGKTYVFLRNTVIGEAANLNGVYALDSSNISGDYLWYIDNANFSAFNQDSVFVYGIISNIFAQRSWIISFDANTGIEKWRKEWGDAIQRSIVFVDNEDIVYVKSNNQIIGYDSNNISNNNPLDDIVYQIDIDEERAKISVSGNDVYFVGKNISKVSK
ncbi:MAG: lamin tail domain-containing protein, partial [Candidatus Pacebacteria bacterium]|nr:lamin tail domain-containing protein [Candidatus Paceibacterota bacterium]